jgi:hypothetical protein
MIKTIDKIKMWIGFTGILITLAVISVGIVMMMR